MSLESLAAYLSTVAGEVSVAFHHASLLICGCGPCYLCFSMGRLSLVKSRYFLCKHIQSSVHSPRRWSIKKKNMNGNSAMVISKLMTHCHFVSEMWACAQSCPTLWDLMDCSPPGFSVQARILERISISYSGGSSWPRDWTPISCHLLHFPVGYHCTTWEAIIHFR